MGDYFEELKTRLTADIDGFKAGMTQAVGISKVTEGAISGHLSSIGTSFLNVGKAVGIFTAALAATGLAVGTALVKHTLEAEDRLAKLSDKTGITVESLAALRQQADLNGIGFEDLTGSLVKLNKNLGEAAKNGGPVADTLKELGLNARDLAKLSPEEAFGKIGDAMQGLGTHAEKTRVSMELFGRSGANLIGTLNQGTAGFQEQLKSVQDLGNALSRADVGKIEAVNDAFTMLSAVVKGFATQLTSALSPFLLKAATDMGEMAKETHGFRGAIDKAVSFAIEAGKVFADVFDAVKISIQAVVVAAASIGVSFWESVNATAKAFLWVKQLLENYGAFVRATFILIKDSAVFIWEKASEAVTKHVSGAKVSLASLMQVMGEYLTSIGSAIGETMQTTAGDLGRSATKGTKEASDAVAVASANMTQSAADVEFAFKNMIPKKEDIDTGFLQDITDDAERILAEQKEKLNKMWAAPLSSEAVQKWSEEAIAYANKVGEAIANAMGSGADTKDEKDKAAKAAQARIDARVKTLDAGYVAEMENYSKLQAAAQADFELGVVNETQRNQILEQLEAEHDDRMTAIQGKSVKQRRDEQKQAQDWSVNYAMNYMGRMASVLEQGGRKQFEIAKALRLGQAVVDTASAAVTGYNNGMTAGGPYYGPVLGAAYAAAAIAFGAVQISTILSSSYGGGGSGGSAPSGAVGGAGGGSAPSGVSGQAERGQAVVFNIQGSVISADSVREMARNLNEFIRDGGHIGSVRAG